MKASLCAGRALAAWLKEGGRPEGGSRLDLWLYRWRAVWLESSFRLLGRTGPAVAPFPFPEGEGLVFVMGFWRAGTTLVHELLAQAPDCSVPCTWQCMDPSLLLHPGAPAKGGAVQRPMDQVTVTPESPQEDEFALMAMGVPSLYRGFLDPRRLPELEGLLESSRWATDGAWVETLKCFLAWCALPDRPRLVVKSPNHLFRFQALKARFPRARFLWVFRSSRDLWRSNLAMWRAMIERYALWRLPEGALECFLEKTLGAYADLLEGLLEEGALEGVPRLAFTALTADPEAQVRGMVEALGFPPWETWDAERKERLLRLPQARSRSSESCEGAPEALLLRLERLQERALLEP